MTTLVDTGILFAAALADLEQAIATAWSDQRFDLVDCTSFAVIERVGCYRAASFDADFAVWRYGAGRKRALRSLPDDLAHVMEARRPSLLDRVPGRTW